MCVHGAHTHAHMMQAHPCAHIYAKPLALNLNTDTKLCVYVRTCVWVCVWVCVCVCVCMRARAQVQGGSEYSKSPRSVEYIVEIAKVFKLSTF